jgi:hypothetical protein
MHPLFRGQPSIDVGLPGRCQPRHRKHKFPFAARRRIVCGIALRVSNPHVAISTRSRSWDDSTSKAPPRLPSAEAFRWLGYGRCADAGGRALGRWGAVPANDRAATPQTRRRHRSSGAHGRILTLERFVVARRARRYGGEERRLCTASSRQVTSQHLDLNEIYCRPRAFAQTQPRAVAICAHDRRHRRLCYAKT